MTQDEIKAQLLENLQTVAQDFVALSVDNLRTTKPTLLREINAAVADGGRLQISISPAPRFSTALVLVHRETVVELCRLEGLDGTSIVPFRKP